MATVFLHVGLADTGSADLQSHLRMDEERLRAAGVVFPRVGRDGATHDALARLLRTLPDDRDPRFLQLRRTLREELDGFAFAILSSDRFATLSGQPLRQLAGLLDGHRVVVLVYLREHLAHWSLKYERAVVQSNLSGAFDSYFQLARNPFSAVVDRFAETFQRGSLILRLADDDAAPERTIVRDFAAATGCAVLGERVATPRSAPHRVGGNLLFVKRVLNSFLDVRQGARLGADVAALALTEAASGPFLVDAPTARRLADLYAADRTRLARRYGLEIAPRLDACGRSASPDAATLEADWTRLRTKALRQALPLGKLMGQVTLNGGVQAARPAPAGVIAESAPAADSSRAAARVALQQLARRVAVLETDTAGATTHDELARQVDDLKLSFAQLRTTATVELRRQFADYVHAIDAARRIAAATSPGT